jgi:hypothetical protein
VRGLSANTRTTERKKKKRKEGKDGISENILMEKYL